MVYLLTRLLKRPLACVGALLGIDTQASGGLLVTLANSVPVYAMTQEMSPRGRIMNVAFIVPAPSLLGAHLAYTSSVASEMVSAMLLAKMSGGIVALILAYLLCRDLPRDRELTDA